MGFDSLMGVELMTAIENRLGVQVPVMVLSEASTLDKLAGVLIQKLHQHDEDVEESPQDALASLAPATVRMASTASPHPPCDRDTMTAKRSELKRQLLEKARQRPTARAAAPSAPSAQGAGATRSVPERFTRFDAHPAINSS